MAKSSYSFICMLHNLIITIMTYLQVLNTRKSSQAYFVKNMSKIKSFFQIFLGNIWVVFWIFFFLAGGSLFLFVCLFGWFFVWGGGVVSLVMIIILVHLIIIIIKSEPWIISHYLWLGHKTTVRPACRTMFFPIQLYILSIYNSTDKSFLKTYSIFSTFLTLHYPLQNKNVYIFISHKALASISK